MKALRAFFVVALALLFLGVPGTQAQEKQEKKEPPVIALTGGTLIDGNGGAPVVDAVVLIQGRKILKAGPASSVKVPEKAERTDVRGKFILPGFIDCHIHTTYPFNDSQYFTDNDASTTLRALSVMNGYLKRASSRSAASTPTICNLDISSIQPIGEGILTFQCK